MEVKDLAQTYRNLKLRGVQLWLDGGWGVDTLPEE